MAGPAAPVAIVTGAARGIGHAIARRLIDGGWRVGAVDLPDAAPARAYAGEARVTCIEGDVAEEATASDAVRTVVETFGRLDGLVSNAGIIHQKPLRDLGYAEWRRIIDVNLSAAYLFARAADAPLRASCGAVVLIASTRAFMSTPGSEAYAASKGGLVALTHALAISLAPDVRVNCVSPGWIATENYGALEHKYHAQHPAGRVGKPQDIAEMVAFLLDGTRSGFATGANFIVDGGMTRKMIYEE
jgi:NAD(P)-dependent dehydrogenase (short-subunit alcohol dehydrogenase family)